MTTTTADERSDIAMCRVSVVGPHTQMDIGLPSDVALASILPAVVELVESRAPERSELEPEPEDRTWHWTLAPIGRDPLAGAETLADSGIRDGDLLVLQKSEAPSPPALFDDVIDAVATLQEHETASWTARAARWTGYVLYLLLLATALAALWWVRRDGLTPVVAGVPIVFGVGGIVAGVIAARAHGDVRTGEVLGTSGIVAVGMGAGLALPDPPTAPHLLFGCAVVAALAIPSLRLLGAGLMLHTALLTAGILGTATAGMAMAPWLSDRQVLALFAVFSFFVVAAAPRIAIAAARLPVPPVPSAGSPIDPGDDAARPTISGVGAVGAMTLPAADRLADRAERSGQILTGITFGATAVLTLCAVLMLDGGPVYRWQTIALAVILGIVTAARSRSHSDLTRAALLVTGGVTILASVFLSLLFADQMVHFAIGLALLFVLAAITLWAGVVVPRVEHSPTARRWVELVEYGLHIALVPLLVWILGVYSLVRNL